jgi:hypothetical protein
VCALSLRQLSCRSAPSRVPMLQLFSCSSSSSSWELDIYLSHGQLITNVVKPGRVTNQDHRFYPSEITTTRIRARGQAFAGFVNWMCVCKFLNNSDPNMRPILRNLVIVVQITPTAIHNIEWRTFIIFACFCFAWVSCQSTISPPVMKKAYQIIDSHGIFLLS